MIIGYVLLVDGDLLTWASLVRDLVLRLAEVVTSQREKREPIVQCEFVNYKNYRFLCASC